VPALTTKNTIGGLVTERVIRVTARRLRGVCGKVFRGGERLAGSAVLTLKVPRVSRWESEDRRVVATKKVKELDPALRVKYKEGSARGGRYLSFARLGGTEGGNNKRAKGEGLDIPEGLSRGSGEEDRAEQGKVGKNGPNEKLIGCQKISNQQNGKKSKAKKGQTPREC